MPANLILLGAAYQAGAIPLEAESIEEAIRLNGIAVEMNLQAFRWGRLYIQDRTSVEQRLKMSTMPKDTGPGANSELHSRMPNKVAIAQKLLDASGFKGAIRRLVGIRVAELILYQNDIYASQYVEFIKTVVAAEREHTTGRTQLGEAVARYLFKLMAYKDEYEVARLLLKEDFFRRVRAQFGEDCQLAFNLHPPILRALGLKHKLRLGTWFTPIFKHLRSLRNIRGTPLDMFGFTKVRRVERELINEYRKLIESLLPYLNDDNHELAVQIAELPDQIRGYEDIKLASVAEFRQRAKELYRQFLSLEPQYECRPETKSGSAVSDQL